MQFWLIGVVGEAKAGAEQEGQVNGVVWKDCQEGCVEKTLASACCGPRLEEWNWGCAYRAGCSTLEGSSSVGGWKENQVLPSMMPG